MAWRHCVGPIAKPGEGVGPELLAIVVLLAVPLSVTVAPAPPVVGPDRPGNIIGLAALCIGTEIHSTYVRPATVALWLVGLNV